MAQSPAPTFFFFDYETWGISPAKDRPCQFAGVRTDADFNIIEEPLVIYCQPPQDYLPAPEAALVTGITPQLTVSKGLSEPEFISKIYAALSHPNTTSVGYNNVRFDDEVTRYTCYRNFYDPYAWAWQKGNSRWDMLDVMRACHALRPDGIQWPENENGFPSFKLEHLSIANGIEHSNAHDAMADVIATIEITKKVKAAQPKLFDYFYEHRNKRKLNTLIDIVNQTPLVHVSGMLGKECQYTSWIVPLAWHPTNSNAVIVADLAKSPEPLISLTAEQLRDRLYTKKENLAESELPVPLKLIHLNKCAILAPAKTLTAENAEQIGIDRQQCLTNLALIRSHSEIREKALEVFNDSTDFAARDVDEQLYDGFFSDADKTAMDIIRETNPDALGSLNLTFEDPRIEPLLFRYRARNYPWTLTLLEQQKWQAHCQNYFETNITNYINNLESLVAQYENQPEKLTVLKSVYDYVVNITN